MYALSRATASTPLALLLVVLLAVIGAGLGFFVQVAILGGQNAVDPGHLGVATGALINFFKTLGGAFGAAIFGAILTGALSGGGGYPAAFRSVFV